MPRMEDPANEYAKFLECTGAKVICVDGIYWYLYSGFLMPAYLPHATPPIDRCNARRAIKSSRAPFARWNDGFDQDQENSWWYIIRKGPYSLDQCSRSTRSKVRRGLKRLDARPVSVSEIQEQGYAVCQAAVDRYDNISFLPTIEKFRSRLDAARQFKGIVEYVGVFYGDTLVGFSENHIQDGGVFWENIWYEPGCLGMYSSYVLVNSMLDYYLNERQLNYVSDGCRSIYHQTHVQEFLVERFGFTKAYASLEVMYSPSLLAVVSLAYPFRKLLGRLSIRRESLAGKGCALLLQESIRRSAL